jgi:hypothetical protein
MCVWSIRASACRSASKRRITWALSMPGLMTFSATCRFTGSRCSATQTAHAALAELLHQPIRADADAHLFGRRLPLAAHFLVRIIQFDRRALQEAPCLSVCLQ